MAYTQKDRFIRPVKEGTRELVTAKVRGEFEGKNPSSYQQHLAYSMFGASYSNIAKAPVLNFKPSTVEPESQPKAQPYSLDREKVFDAPGLAANYFYNPLCWGYPFVYVGLNSTLYSFDVDRGEATKIPRPYKSNITALGANYQHVALCSDNAVLQIIDQKECKITAIQKSNTLFTQIVPNGWHGFYLLNQRMIVHYDTRSGSTSFVSLPGYLSGFAYNADTNTLGVNSDSIRLFDTRIMKNENPESTLEFNNHKSPGKALTFFGNTVASGGGAHDKTVQIWNATSGKLIAMADTQSQVCNIHWINATDILVTCGHSSNSVSIYQRKGKELVLEAQDNRSTDRVLFSAQNPVKPNMVINGAPDEYLRLWSILSPQKFDSPKPSPSIFNTPGLR